MKRADRPNILVLMTDQHHADCLGYTGKRAVRTPNIDKLAGTGVRFDRAYTVHGTCVPSRVSYLTGMYPHSHGVFGNDNDPIPDNLLSLGTFLRRYGYRTAITGKKHLPQWTAHGFQYQRLCYEADAPVRRLHYYNYLKELGLHQWYDELGDVERFCLGPEEVPEEHSLEHWTADETIRYLRQPSDGAPFFMLASFERPHPPLTLPKHCRFQYDPDDVVLPENIEDADSAFFFDRNVELLWRASRQGEKALRTAMAKYYTLITLIDDHIGRILDALEEQGLRENTVILFCSDHGDFAGEYGRMAKGFPYEAIHRIPFVWNWPTAFRQGKVETGFARNIDFFPTVCDLLGLDPPPAVQGTSLLPQLTTDAPSTVDAVFFESVCVKSVRTTTHKLNYALTGNGEQAELFDMVRDPHEYNNVFNEPAYGDVREALLRRLLQWTIETQQPVNFGRKNEDYPRTRWLSNPD